MKNFVGIVMTLFICMTFRGYTQQVESKRYSFKVKVQIEGCKDGDTKTLIESYINRELRDLGDVLIASQSMIPTHYLNIIAIELTKGVEEYKTGAIAISITHVEYITSLCNPVVSGHLSHETIKVIADNNINNILADKKWNASIHLYRGSYLQVGNTNQLSDICKSIVANFDIKTLQVARER